MNRDVLSCEMSVIGIEEFDGQVRIVLGWILVRRPMHAGSNVRV